MGIQVIEGHFLIESPAEETDQQFCDAVEGLIVQTYSRRPDWLGFSPGVRFTRGASHFREFVCMAGSVSCALMLRAGRDAGLPRAIIYRAEDGGVHRAYEIRGGHQTEFAPDELHVAELGTPPNGGSATPVADPGDAEGRRR